MKVSDKINLSSVLKYKKIDKEHIKFTVIAKNKKKLYAVDAKNYMQIYKEYFFYLYHTQKYLVNNDLPIYTEKEIKEQGRYDLESTKCFLIFVKEKNSENYKIVGHIEIYDRAEKDVVGLGYGILPQKEGNGYGTAILKKILELLKNNHTIKKIRLTALKNNSASLMVAQKNGFKIIDEGTYLKNEALVLEKDNN